MAIATPAGARPPVGGVPNGYLYTRLHPQRNESDSGKLRSWGTGMLSSWGDAHHDGGGGGGGGGGS